MPFETEQVVIREMFFHTVADSVEDDGGAASICLLASSFVFLLLDFSFNTHSRFLGSFLATGLVMETRRWGEPLRRRRPEGSHKQRQEGAVSPRIKTGARPVTFAPTRRRVAGSEPAIFIPSKTGEIDFQVGGSATAPALISALPRWFRISARPALVQMPPWSYRWCP